MIQLKILSGNTAGAELVARRFPVRVGRSPQADLRLEEAGVWDSHLLISMDPADGFVLTVQPGALAFINTQPVERAILRNGDLIEVGAAKMQFGLSPTRPRGLRFRESLTWIALALLCLGQVALLYWLPG